jgi:hypothetical protein
MIPICLILEVMIYLLVSVRPIPISFKLLKQKCNASEYKPCYERADFIFKKPLSLVLAFQLFEKAFRRKLVQQALIDETVQFEFRLWFSRLLGNNFEHIG